jgi:ribonuclease P protein component
LFCPHFGAKTSLMTAPLIILKKRSEFLAAARAQKCGTKGLMLQARSRGDEAPMRVGFTCSKKVGNAVARNRAKRRLREAARAVLPVNGRSGYDYVLIGRFETTANRDFEALKGDLAYALGKVHVS